MKKRIALVLSVCIVCLLAVSCSEPQVDPDLKAMLDAYEQAADSYVEMVDQYCDTSKQGDIAALTGLSADCLRLMSEYEDVYAKVEEVDYSNLNDVSIDYYEEVTTRVLEKIADALKKFNEIAGASTEKTETPSTSDMADLLDSESELLDNASELLEQLQ